MTHIFKSHNGAITFQNDSKRERFATDLKTHNGAKYKVERITPESKNQRGFFEGAVIVLATYFQEHLDYRDSADCKKMHEWVKQEFCPEYVVIDGTSRKIAGTTKGRLQGEDGLIEKVIQYLEDEHGVNRIECLDPKKYKAWKDELYSTGMWETYIDYLVSMRKLPQRSTFKMSSVMQKTI